MRKFITAGMVIAMLAVPAASVAKDSSPAYTTTVGTCGSGPSGSIAVSKGSKGVATFTVPTNMAYGVIKMPQTNLKVKDIKTLGFKSNSSAGGMVYMNVITNDGHKIKYTPSAQAFPEPGIGSWFAHDMLTSGVRFNDADDSTPATTWTDAVSQYGDETVNRVSITAGCSLGSGTVQVDDMQVNSSVIDFK